MYETQRRQGPDYTKLYQTLMDSDYGTERDITHYIRFFPDGTLLSVAAPDFAYTDNGCYQDAYFIQRLLVPGVELDVDDGFGILAGTFSMKDGVLTYRINIGSQIFEEGSGYFYACKYSLWEERLHVDFRNPCLGDAGGRDYGTHY